MTALTVSMLALSASGSMHPVSGSTSMKRGRAPRHDTGSAVAMKVWAGTATSSPGPMPSAASTRWIEAVPDPVPMAWSAWQNSAKACSSSATSRPWMNRVLSTTSCMAASMASLCCR
jgi:hypothetical protein